MSRLIQLWDSSEIFFGKKLLSKVRRTIKFAKIPFTGKLIELNMERMLWKVISQTFLQEGFLYLKQTTMAKHLEDMFQ